MGYWSVGNTNWGACPSWPQRGSATTPFHSWLKTAGRGEGGVGEFAPVSSNISAPHRNTFHHLVLNSGMHVRDMYYLSEKVFLQIYYNNSAIQITGLSFRSN